MADVTTTFAAKDVGFAATMQRLQSRLARFQASMSRFGAAAARMRAAFSGLAAKATALAAAYVGVTVAMNAMRKAIDMGGKFNDLSTSTGEAAGNLAVLERAFQNAGIDGSRVGPVLSKMAGFIGDMRNGMSTATRAAAALGISLSDLEGKTPIEQMRVFMQAIAGAENKTRALELAGDIFGDRLGYKLIPLAANFAGEMKNAGEELGSLVPILNEANGRLDTLGDRLNNAISQKPAEFFTGFLAAVSQGTDDVAEAVAKLDAAGAGLDFGKLFKGAMEAPELAFLAMGETLLLYIKKAGNALVEASLFAGEVYRKSLTDPAMFSRIASGFGNALGLWANHFNRILASGIKTILQPLTLLERIFGPGVISGAIAQIERLQAGLDASAESMGKALSDALAGGADRMSEIARNTARPTFQLFDEADQKAQADAAFNRLRQLGTPESNAPAKTQYESEIEDIYRQEKRRIMETLADGKRIRALAILERQYQQALKLPAMQQPAPPPQEQMQQNAISQAIREELARQASASAMPATAQEEVASEPTLKRAVDLLAELNTKLPQPVLA